MASPVSPFARECRLAWFSRRIARVRFLRRLSVRDGPGGGVSSVATQFVLHVADPSANSCHAFWFPYRHRSKRLKRKQNHHHHHQHHHHHHHHHHRNLLTANVFLRSLLPTLTLEALASGFSLAFGFGLAACSLHLASCRRGRLEFAVHGC